MVAIMNTFAIYEQFRTVLGEVRAKDFAETIGKMIDYAKNAATKEDVRLLRESAEANTSRLDAALAKLAEAQARTEDRLERLEQTVEKLAEAQARTEARVDELAQAQARTEAKLEQLVEIVTKLVIRSDRHEGDLLELRFRDRLPSYLGRLLRKAKVIEAADLIDTIEPTVGTVAVDDFLRADVIATGMLDGSSTYLVGEISYTADEGDVMRAARQTACLRKAGVPAIGLVACEQISPQTTEYALKEGVFVWVDGRVLTPESPPQSPAA